MEKLKLPSLLELDDTLEWTYAMRRDMQEIIPGLFLGPYSAAMKSKAEHLVQNGVSHIICVRQEIEAHFIRPNFPDRFKYLVLDIADTVTMNIIQFLPKVKKFIDDCFSSGELISKNHEYPAICLLLSNKRIFTMKGKVLVHGNAGISRSAALVIGYVMETYGLPYKEAFALVQHKRFCINPNEGFAQQLKEYEPIYKAKRTLQNGETSQVTGKLKRRIEEVEDAEGGSNSMDVCEEIESHPS